MNLDPGARMFNQSDEPAIDSDAEHDDEHDRQRDRFEEQRPERRRRHLGQRLDRRFEHEQSPRTDVCGAGFRVALRRVIRTT